MEDDENGHDPTEMVVEEAFRGAVLNTAKLVGQDGKVVLSGQDLGKQGGVHHRLITAIDEDKDYRQEFKTGFYGSTQEQNDVLAGYNERRRYGCDTSPVIDLVIIRSAGLHGGRFQRILNSISSTTFNTNFNKGNKGRNDKARSNSPLA